MESLFHKKDGFNGEISFVLPPDMSDMCQHHPLVHALYTTDIGYYPNAKYHWRERPHGAPENILILCTDGRGWLELPSGRIEIGPDRACIIPHDVPHSYGADSNEPWSIYWGHFRGESAQYFVRRLERSDALIEVSERTRGRVLATFDALFTPLREGYNVQSVISTALGFGEILGALIFANESFHPDLESEANRRIDHTIRHMVSQVESSTTLSELAAIACLSETRYSQLFKTKTGYPPIEYYVRLKIQRACHYLDATSMKVYAISQTLGYSDPYYFSRVFHKVMGISPNAYRNRSKPSGARQHRAIDEPPY